MKIPSIYEVLRGVMYPLESPAGLDIIDAGANTGQTAERYKGWWPEARIHCFEPNSKAFATLQEGWGDIPGMTLHQEALGAVNGSATLNCGAGNRSDVSSLRLRSAKYAGELPLTSTEKVMVVTLDTRIDRGVLPQHIHLLKMDLQGGELHALYGAAESLEKQRFDVIFSEVWLQATYRGAPLYWELARYLDTHGYKTWWIRTEAYPDDTEGRWGDAIFVSRDYAKSIGY